MEKHETKCGCKSKAESEYQAMTLTAHELIRLKQANSSVLLNIRDGSFVAGHHNKVVADQKFCGAAN